MGRFFLADLRRIFSNRTTVALCIVIPLAVMLLFASVIAPRLVTQTRVSSSCFAVCNEDGTQASRQFVDYVANSKSIRDVVYILTVTNLDEGLAMVERGEVSGMLHIPAGFYEGLRAGRNESLDLYSTPAYRLESALVKIAVQNALDIVGRGQNALDSAREYAVEQGADARQAEIFYNGLVQLGTQVVTDRRAMLGDGGFLSAVGEYMPAEYYLSAMLALFLALATLPLAGFSAGDFSASVLQRGMRTGALRVRFLTARLLSGAVFLLLVTLLIFPIGWGAASLDRIFDGSLPALLLAMGVMALSFSALSLALAAWAPGSDAALWLGFWLILAFSMAGGAILPEGVLPLWLRNLGLWSPVRASMRLLAGTVFQFDAGQYRLDVLKTSLWGVGAAAAAAAGFLWKGAA